MVSCRSYREAGNVLVRANCGRDQEEVERAWDEQVIGAEESSGYWQIPISVQRSVQHTPDDSRDLGATKWND